MTRRALDEYRKLANAHGGKSGKIILELLAEIERAGAFRLLGRELRAVTEEDPWPYRSEHQGKPIREVPDDFLCHWLMQRNRKALKVDADLALQAQCDLKLYDYINARLKRKSDQGEQFIHTEEEAIPTREDLVSGVLSSGNQGDDEDLISQTTLRI